ncbi:carboxymuconolactone decarboxylase family protein [Murinocardiopsis flavida]|nr:carboxymuconolactone decarboxylase family protein [Murinocardiopsis flavida]
MPDPRPPDQQARHGRLHWTEPAAMTAEQRAIYDGVLAKYGPEPPFPLTDAAGRLHGPFNAMLAAPGVGAALQALSAAVGGRTSLAPRVRETVILAVAAARASAFELAAHTAAGAAAGLTSDEIATLCDGTAPASLAADEQAAHAFAASLLRDGDADDACYVRAERHFGEAGIVELITLVGYYDLLATLLRTLRVPVPE